MQLKTERLIIRQANLEDAPFFLKLLNDVTYISSIRDSQVRTLEEAKAFIQSFYLDKYRDLGFGLYVMTLKGKAVGVCGLVKREGLDMPDLGFALLQEYVGFGLVQEASQAVLKYAKEKLEISQLAAITTKENKASQKVLVRLGFRFSQEIELPQNPKTLELYLKKLD